MYPCCATRTPFLVPGLAPKMILQAPVLRISGPSSASLPSSFLKGNTAYLTKKPSTLGSSTRPARLTSCRPSPGRRCGPAVMPACRCAAGSGWPRSATTRGEERDGMSVPREWSRRTKREPPDNTLAIERSAGSCDLLFPGGVVVNQAGQVSVTLFSTRPGMGMVIRVQ
jgi:hypothetical protein